MLLSLAIPAIRDGYHLFSSYFSLFPTFRPKQRIKIYPVRLKRSKIINKDTESLHKCFYDR